MKCSGCSAPLVPVVGLDLDGTMGDYHGSLLDFAERWLGVTGTGWALTYDGSVKLAEHMGIDDHVYRQMKLAYRQGGMKRMMPIKAGAFDMVQMLRKEGCEVWITTTRPYNRFDSTDPDTREWLRRNGIHYDHMIYEDDKYHRLVELVDPARIVGVLDDLPAMYDQAEAAGLRPIMLASRYNRALRRPRMAATMADAAVQLARQIQLWKVRNQDANH